MKTNTGLVEHSEMALRQKWGYVWGTFGQILSPVIFQQKLKQYPKGVGNYRTFIQKNWLNKRSVDCIGLLKSYLWWNGGNVKYNPSQDKNADMSFNLAKEKGTIGTMPEIPGLILYKRGHVGVYIGDNKVIEARGTTAGVIKSPLKGSGSAGWTHWFKSPYINYERKSVEVSKPKEQTVSEWAKEGYSFVTKNKISDGARPKDNVTREEVWEMIRRYDNFRG